MAKNIEEYKAEHAAEIAKGKDIEHMTAEDRQTIIDDLGKKGFKILSAYLRRCIAATPPKNKVYSGNISIYRLDDYKKAVMLENVVACLDAVICLPLQALNGEIEYDFPDAGGDYSVKRKQYKKLFNKLKKLKKNIPSEAAQVEKDGSEFEYEVIKYFYEVLYLNMTEETQSDTNAQVMNNTVAPNRKRTQDVIQLAREKEKSEEIKNNIKNLRELKKEIEDAYPSIYWDIKAKHSSSNSLDKEFLKAYTAAREELWTYIANYLSQDGDEKLGAEISRAFINNPDFMPAWNTIENRVTPSGNGNKKALYDIAKKALIALHRQAISQPDSAERNSVIGLHETYKIMLKTEYEIVNACASVQSSTIPETTNGLNKFKKEMEENLTSITLGLDKTINKKVVSAGNKKKDGENSAVEEKVTQGVLALQTKAHQELNKALHYKVGYFGKKFVANDKIQEDEVVALAIQKKITELGAAGNDNQTPDERNVYQKAILDLNNELINKYEQLLSKRKWFNLIFDRRAMLLLNGIGGVLSHIRKLMKNDEMLRSLKYDGQPAATPRVSLS